MAKKIVTPSTTQQCKILTTVSGELMHVLHTLHEEVEKRIEGVLSKKEGLSLSQYMVLVGFASDDTSSLSQAKLAERLRLTEATISRHIGILITKKLLVRKKAENNKKSYSLSLTTYGVKVFEKTETVILEAIEKCFSSLNAQEKIITRDTLRKVVGTLTNK